MCPCMEALVIATMPYDLSSSITMRYYALVFANYLLIVCHELVLAVVVITHCVFITLHLLCVVMRHYLVASLQSWIVPQRAENKVVF